MSASRALHTVELTTGDTVPCDVLFAHPPQRQVDLVQSLALELDEHGLVLVQAMKGETSTPGIYAAGDLTTRGQSAIFAASAGALAAGMINVDLAMDPEHGGLAEPAVAEHALPNVSSPDP